jgi:hypothetical protein
MASLTTFQLVADAVALVAVDTKDNQKLKKKEHRLAATGAFNAP